MKKVLFLILLFTQVACSNNTKIRVKKEYTSVEPVLQSYVEEFIRASNGKITKKHFDGFTMGFKDYGANSNVVGTCHYSVNEVDISEVWWNRSSTHYEKTALIFHELGHCILKRGHTNKPTYSGFVPWLERIGFKLGIFKELNDLSDGCPASLMNTSVVGDRCTVKHFNYYLQELFNNSDKPYSFDSNRLKRKTNSVQIECPKPKIINKTNEWNADDESTLRRAGRRCIEKYNTCLKKFYKNNQHSYAAICE